MTLLALLGCTQPSDTHGKHPPPPLDSGSAVSDTGRDSDSDSVDSDSAPPGPRTWTVCGDGTAEFMDLPEAVEAAGDELDLCAGASQAPT